MKYMICRKKLTMMTHDVI